MTIALLSSYYVNSTVRKWSILFFLTTSQNKQHYQDSSQNTVFTHSVSSQGIASLSCKTITGHFLLQKLLKLLKLLN